MWTKACKAACRRLLKAGTDPYLFSPSPFAARLDGLKESWSRARSHADEPCWAVMKIIALKA